MIDHTNSFPKLKSNPYHAKIYHGQKNCIRNSKGIIIRQMTEKEINIRKSILSSEILYLDDSNLHKLKNTTDDNKIYK